MAKFLDESGLGYFCGKIKSLILGKAEKDLSNVPQSDFEAKADAAGLGDMRTSVYDTSGKATDVFAYVDEKARGGSIPIVETSGTNTAYTATVDGVTALTKGQMLIILPHINSNTFSPTLNVNGLGAKGIRRCGTMDSTHYLYFRDTLRAGVPVLLMYSGQFWGIYSTERPVGSNDFTYAVAASKGGTGRTYVTAGNYLVGNGTDEMKMKTPEEVLSDIGALSTAGGTMTGELTLSGAPTSGQHAATKAYVDGKAPLTVMIENGEAGYTSSHTAKEIYEALESGTPVFANSFGYVIPAFGSGFDSAAQRYQVHFSSTSYGPAGPGNVNIMIETTSGSTTVTAGMKQVLKTCSVTLPAAGWDATAKTQTVTVAGVTTNSAVIPSPEAESWEAAGKAGVRCTAQAANNLTFACATVPSVDLTYSVLIQEVQ